MSADAPSSLLKVRFRARVFDWRGPSPFFFVELPARHVAAIRQAARTASYGWGVVPVGVKIGTATFRTSLIPKDGGYRLPLKAAVREAAQIAMDDEIAVELEIRIDR